MVTPTFNSAKLRNMTTLVNDAIKELCDRIGQCSHDGNNEFDIYPLYQSLTMDAICRAAFGIRTNCQQSAGDHPLVAASREVMR